MEDWDNYNGGFSYNDVLVDSQPCFFGTEASFIAVFP